MLDQDKSKQQLIEKLQNSERTLRTLMDASPESILLLDTSGTVLFANETTAQRQGTTVDKIVGSKPKDTLPPKLATDRMERLEEVVRTGKAVRFCDERAERYYEIAMHPVFDEQGKVAAVAVLSIDRTEQKQAEEALKKARDELEQRVKERTAELAKANEKLNIFRKFVEAAGEGFGMADLDGRIAYANPVLCRLMGEENLEDVIGKNISAYYPEEYMQRRGDEMIPALLRQEYWYTETKVLRRDGTQIPIQQCSFLIRDESGNPFCTGVVISDISERKQAAEALAREHRNLRHMLRSSDNERQLIAYEIHDGLAQQLAGAIMQLQAFDHLKDNTPKEAAKAYDAAMTMLQQGYFETRRLIADVRSPILDEAGVAEAISHLVHEQSRDKQPKIEYRSRVDFDRLDPTLENAIYRIAQEALTNACKHSRSKRVRVGLLQRGDRLRIEIRDWGVGFDPKTVPKSHFGLEGIRQRARLLGGKCSIRSTTGKGACVTVELPVVPRDEQRRL